ncbi:MAG TPA: hypothetical protein ENG95_03625 [Nitrospirae bacterium]|nr:hypothetical protein [Nitrospirota bacterium]
MKEATDNLATTGEPSRVKLFYYAEMDDNGIVYLTCDKGHNTAAVHLSRKHQFLFQSGCHALLDHYTNEAVSMFSAALERAYEFFLRVAYRRLGLPSTLFDTSWKHVKAQSQRQFGAFVFLFAVIADEPFELPKEIPKLRNDVIHQGYIASFDEVLKYAENIFTLIRRIMQVLRDKCPTEMWAEINEANEVRKMEVPSGMEWTGLAETEFDLTVDLTFQTWLSELRKLHEGQSP